jgi:hypothetical protein
MSLSDCAQPRSIFRCWHRGSAAFDLDQFDKRSQLLIRVHNEALSVATMRVCNPDYSSAGINS